MYFFLHPTILDDYEYVDAIPQPFLYIGRHKFLLSLVMHSLLYLLYTLYVYFIHILCIFITYVRIIILHSIISKFLYVFFVFLFVILYINFTHKCLILFIRQKRHPPKEVSFSYFSMTDSSS